MFDLESVKFYRLKKRITQKSLAKNIGVTTSTISKIENNNKGINPNLSTLINLGDKLGICPVVFMNCNCSDCKIKLRIVDRLNCKMNTLNTISQYVITSKKIVEEELLQLDSLNKNKFTYGDIKFIRE